MARIEELLDRVQDPSLREALAVEVGRVKERTSFGLVFERHLPESVALHNFPVRVSSLVSLRTDPESRTVYQVTAITGDTATLVDRDSGDQRAATLGQLVVIRDFGDPIYTALNPVGAVTRGGDKPYHAVINGENFHALQMLAYLYRDAVDVLYIDPPYNTGSRDWRYNNRYVDATDQWRHSKWLSFMDKRLRLARRLLKKDGVLIVTIDEHEVNHLGVLLEQVFPEYLRYMVTIVINPKGTFKQNFGRVDEQAFFVVPDLGRDIVTGQPTARAVVQSSFVDGTVELDGVADEEKDEGDDSEELGDGVGTASESIAQEQEYEDLYLRRRGEESSYRHQRPNQFYAIFVKEDIDPKGRRTGTVVGIGPALTRADSYEINRQDGILSVYPIDAEGNERVWRYSRQTMQQYIDDGAIVVGQYNTKLDIYALNHRRPKKSVRRLKTVWWDPSHDAGVHGTNVVKAFLGKPGLFPFPKSLYAVRDCLAAVVRDRPDALVLDFFAGSGTTLHATVLLNAQDGGRRRCVLVTNNEVDTKTAARLNAQGLYRGDPAFEAHGIFEQVTRPRCEAAVTGRRPDGKPVAGRYIGGQPYAEGFEENIEFYRLDYLDPESVELGREFEAILPSLWLMSGAEGPRESAGDCDWSIPAGGTYAVLFKEASIRRFVEQLGKLPSLRRVFLVTDSAESFAEMREMIGERWPTSMLYRDYLRNFRINTLASL